MIFKTIENFLSKQYITITQKKHFIFIKFKRFYSIDFNVFQTFYLKLLGKTKKKRNEFIVINSEAESFYTYLFFGKKTA